MNKRERQRQPIIIIIGASASTTTAAHREVRLVGGVLGWDWFMSKSPHNYVRLRQEYKIN